MPIELILTGIYDEEDETDEKQKNRQTDRHIVYCRNGRRNRQPAAYERAGY